MATDERGLATVHSERGIEPANACRSSAGPDVGAIAGQRLCQNQTAVTETGNAQLPEPCAAEDRVVTISGGSQAGSGAAGGIATPTRVVAGGVFASSSPA